MQQEAPSLRLRCSEAVDCCSLNYYLPHYRSAQQGIVQGRLWKEICPDASWLTTHFLFHGFLVQTATWYICALQRHVYLLREGDTKCLAAPAPITWPASCPPNLRILFTLGACTRAHTNTQQLPEVLKSYRFFTQCWIMYSELKKTTFITTGLASMGSGGELLPSTGNNLDTSKRPGIKGLFFFFFSPHQENFSSLIQDWERSKGFLLMQCVLKIMELYRFLRCPFWGRWAFWSGH